MLRSDDTCLRWFKRRVGFQWGWTIDGSTLCKYVIYSEFGICAEKMEYCAFLFSYFFGDHLSIYGMVYHFPMLRRRTLYAIPRIQLVLFYDFNFTLNCHYQVIARNANVSLFPHVFSVSDSIALLVPDIWEI